MIRLTLIRDREVLVAEVCEIIVLPELGGGSLYFTFVGFLPTSDEGRLRTGVSVFTLFERSHLVESGPAAEVLKASEHLRPSRVGSCRLSTRSSVTAILGRGRLRGGSGGRIRRIVTAYRGTSCKTSCTDGGEERASSLSIHRYLLKRAMDIFS